jgi:RNA polymerase I specific transcription initiation factor RRN3
MLVDQFNIKKMSYDAPSPIPQLRLWLQALMHVVSRLDRTHMALIEAVLRLPWMTMDSSLVKTYTSFIQILVSARPEYLSLVLGRIAQGFTYRASSPRKLKFATFFFMTARNLQNLVSKLSTSVFLSLPQRLSHDA